MSADEAVFVQLAALEEEERQVLKQIKEAGIVFA